MQFNIISSLGVDGGKPPHPRLHAETLRAVEGLGGRMPHGILARKYDILPRL